MSMCNFSIPFSGNPDDILARAKAAVESQGGNFTGDATSGNFNVTVLGNTARGSYVISEKNLNLTISEKPFLIPCSIIESFLRSQLSK